MFKRCCHSKLRRVLLIVCLTIPTCVYVIPYITSVQLNNKTYAKQQLESSSSALSFQPVTRLPTESPPKILHLKHLGRIQTVATLDETSMPNSSPPASVVVTNTRSVTNTARTKENVLKHLPPQWKGNAVAQEAKGSYWDRNKRLLAAKQAYLKKRQQLEKDGILSSGREWLITDSRNDTLKSEADKHFLGVPKDLNPTDVAQNPQMIIILAYMHTGSTYVGSMFQNHPGTFYEYEPLRSLQAETRNNQNIMFLNGTTRLMTGDLVEPDLGSWAVKNMLHCNHHRLDIATLVKYYFSLNNEVMRDTRAYFECLRVRQWYDSAKMTVRRRQAIAKTIFYTPTMKSRIQRCLPYLVNKCKVAKIRVSKFIRMNMEIGKRLLQKIPNLKIIHLLRDPRAMMDSQVRKGDMGTRNLRIYTQETKTMCVRMLADIRLRNRLRHQFPDRIMDIRYEDILLNPLVTAESMFQFADVPYLETDETFVKQRSFNTNKTIEMRESVWKRHMEQIRLNIVNQYCSEVFDELGYVKYDQMVDIRNQSNPTFTVDSKYSTKRVPTV